MKSAQLTQVLINLSQYLCQSLLHFQYYACAQIFIHFRDVKETTLW